MGACTWVVIQGLPLSDEEPTGDEASHRSVNASLPFGWMAMSMSPPPRPVRVREDVCAHDVPPLVERQTELQRGTPAGPWTYSVPSGATSTPGSLMSFELTTTGVLNVAASA